MSIILPYTQRETELPITIVEPGSLTIADEEMLVAMSENPPETKFRHGDLAYLIEVPPYLRNQGKLIPRMWQVRFIISTWQHELMRLVHERNNSIIGVDHACTLIERQGIPRNRYGKPIIYAHAFPHGLYPDSAAWFPERVLKRVALKDPTQPWPTILDEAKAPFVGYDGRGLSAPYTFDLAPDLYSNGENLGRPFSFEEATTHTASLLGMEQVLFVPVDPYHINAPYAVDPAHDIFKK